MSRLIDADELKTAFPCGEYVRTESVRATIDSMPTIEAEPVRHGKWDDTRVAFYRKCSECGATIKNTLSHVFLDYDIRDLHYCPNCGAKMDGEAT